MFLFPLTVRPHIYCGHWHIPSVLPMGECIWCFELYIYYIFSMPPIKWIFIFTFCHNKNILKNEVLNYKYYVTLVIFFIVSWSILQYEIFYPPANFQVIILDTKQDIKKYCNFLFALFSLCLETWMMNK